MHKLLTDKKEIIAWLYKYEVENYTVIKDKHYGYAVDVEGSVDLANKKLKAIKVKFNRVSGLFNCSLNHLTSLVGAPQIVGDGFDCSYNQLANLFGAPQQVERYFDCSNNNITNLEGYPKKADCSCLCYSNKLVSLEGGPEKVDYYFDCSHNQLLSLKGAPQIINGTFDCYDNQISSLEHFPLVSEDINISENPALGHYQEFDTYGQFKEVLDIIQERNSLDSHTHTNSINKVKHKI